jgi:hypothetical protein
MEILLKFVLSLSFLFSSPLLFFLTIHLLQLKKTLGTRVTFFLCFVDAFYLLTIAMSTSFIFVQNPTHFYFIKKKRINDIYLILFSCSHRLTMYYHPYSKPSISFEPCLFFFPRFRRSKHLSHSLALTAKNILFIQTSFVYTYTIDMLLLLLLNYAFVRSPSPCFVCFFFRFLLFLHIGTLLFYIS